MTIFSYACQKIYDPELEPEMNNIPVIQGILTDQKNESSIKMSTAQIFGEKHFPNIPDALISILETDGNSTEFFNIDRGTYVPVLDDFQGNPGKEYRLRVELSDGSVLESTPCKMPAPANRFNLFAETGIKKIIDKNVSGDLIVNDAKGLYVYLDMESDEDEQQFYRLSTTVIYQFMYYWYAAPNLIIPVYIWNVRNIDQLPNLAYTTKNNNIEIIRKKETGFLEYIHNPATATDTSSAIMPMGWIAIHNIYSIEKQSYLYYQDIHSLLTAEDRIFDPLPSQIEGNLHYINKQNETVLGFFEVSSLTTSINAFNWSNGSDIIQQKKLEHYSPPKSSGISFQSPPPFWIEF